MYDKCETIRNADDGDRDTEVEIGIHPTLIGYSSIKLGLELQIFIMHYNQLLNVSKILRTVAKLYPSSR